MVQSSLAGASPQKCWTRSKMDSSELLQTAASSRRSSPKNSPVTFSASVTPSVTSRMREPGSIEDGIAVKLGLLDQADGEVGGIEIFDAGGRAEQGMDVAAVDVVEDPVPAQLENHHGGVLADILGADVVVGDLGDATAAAGRRAVANRPCLAGLRREWRPRLPCRRRRRARARGCCRRQRRRRSLRQSLCKGWSGRRCERRGARESSPSSGSAGWRRRC